MRERRLDVPLPQICRLEHVHVAVKHLEAALCHAYLSARLSPWLKT